MNKRSFFKAGAAVAIASVCVMVFSVSCFVAGLADEYEGVEAPTTLVETEVGLDIQDVSGLHTLDDWQSKFYDLLQEAGWEYSPYLVSVSAGASCREPTQMNWIRMDFEAKEYSGIVPFLRYAATSYDPKTNGVSIRIEEQALRLKRASELDLSRYRIGFTEAIDIADINGGEQYKQDLNDNCGIAGYLRNGMWEILYSPEGPNTGPHLSVQIDAIMGSVERSREF